MVNYYWVWFDETMACHKYNIFSAISVLRSEPLSKIDQYKITKVG